MSEENRMLTRQFVEFGYVYRSGELDSNEEENLRSQLLERRMTFSEIGRRIKAIFAPLSTPVEAFIQSVRELNERSSTRSTERIVKNVVSTFPQLHSQNTEIFSNTTNSTWLTGTRI